MNIRLTDNYELRRMDALNWRLYEYKPVKKLDKPARLGGKRTGEVAMEWVALECYPRDIEHAIRWIFEYAPKRNWANAECDLRGAIEELRAVERDMAAHAREFEKAVAG